VFATHAILALFGHDPTAVSEHAWVGGNLVAHHILSFDVQMHAFLKKK